MICGSTPRARRVWLGDARARADAQGVRPARAAGPGRRAGRQRARMLMSDVWDENWFGSTKTLDVHVAGCAASSATTRPPRATSIPCAASASGSRAPGRGSRAAPADAADRGAGLRPAAGDRRLRRAPRPQPARPGQRRGPHPGPGPGRSDRRHRRRPAQDRRPARADHARSDRSPVDPGTGASSSTSAARCSPTAKDRPRAARATRHGRRSPPRCAAAPYSCRSAPPHPGRADPRHGGADRP